MLRMIFWDNDGVLVDTERLYFQANKEVLRDQGVELTSGQYREFFLRQCQGAWHILSERGFDEERIRKLRAFRNERYSELLRCAGKELVIDGVYEMLESLSKKIRMAVVTSSRRDHFNIIHSKLDLSGFFEFVITSDDVQKVKPDPEPYLCALSRSGLSPSECLVIEDSERGLIAASTAGLKCWIVPSDLTASGNFQSADRVFSGIGDLFEALSASF